MSKTVGLRPCRTHSCAHTRPERPPPIIATVACSCKSTAMYTWGWLLCLTFFRDALCPLPPRPRPRPVASPPRASSEPELLARSSGVNCAREATRTFLKRCALGMACCMPAFMAARLHPASMAPLLSSTGGEHWVRHRQRAAGLNGCWMTVQGGDLVAAQRSASDSYSGAARKRGGRKSSVKLLCGCCDTYNRTCNHVATGGVMSAS